LRQCAPPILDQLGQFVLGQQVDVKIEIVALIAAAKTRFWLINTNVDRKMATGAAMARITNDGWKCGRLGTRLMPI
jgi:hypothetical protein